VENEVPSSNMIPNIASVIFQKLQNFAYVANDFSKVNTCGK
jgi:hypothetical protein